MKNLYDADIIAWAHEQISLLRAGHYAQLDIDNLIEEIDDVARSERRELQSRMAVLLAHLLKWEFQPRLRGHSWRNTIKEQRASLHAALQKTPSLRPLLTDAEWLEETYRRAKIETYGSTALPLLPTTLPWTMAQILAADFLPEDGDEDPV